MSFINKTQILLSIPLKEALGKVCVFFWEEARRYPKSNRGPQITHLWSNNPNLRQFLGSGEACA